MRVDLALLVTVALACSGCQPAASPSASDAGAAPAEASTHWWKCGEMALETVHRDEMLTLSGPFGERVLKPKETPSGVRYSDDQGNEFWSKGDEATLMIDWKEQDECVSDDASATD
jgi:membrane-bound inhibitor of C-type lysozyme